MTTFLPNNRQTQKLLETYKTKIEKDEGLILFKKKFSPVSVKFLKYILKTNGVTQAKYSTIAEAIGVSESYLHRKVLKEINGKLGENILITRETQKLDHTKSKRVRGSFYKIILPLNKIKYLIDRQEEKQKAEHEAFMDELSSIPGVDIPDNSSVESPSKISCESKIEDEKSESQLRSIKKDLPNKDLNNLIKDDQTFKASSKKIGIKKEIKNYINSFFLFRDFSNWSQAKKYEVTRTLQLSIVKHDADIQDEKTQYMIKGAVAAFSEKYLKKPQDEFLRLFYTYVSNALKNVYVDESEVNQDDSEDYPFVAPYMTSILKEKGIW